MREKRPNCALYAFSGPVTLLSATQSSSRTMAGVYPGSQLPGLLDEGLHDGSVETAAGSRGPGGSGRRSRGRRQVTQADVPAGVLTGVELEPSVALIEARHGTSTVEAAPDGVAVPTPLRTLRVMPRVTVIVDAVVAAGTAAAAACAGAAPASSAPVIASETRPRVMFMVPPRCGSHRDAHGESRELVRYQTLGEATSTPG